MFLSKYRSFPSFLFTGSRPPLGFGIVSDFLGIRASRQLPFPSFLEFPLHGVTFLFAFRAFYGIRASQITEFSMTAVMGLDGPLMWRHFWTISIGPPLLRRVAMLEQNTNLSAHNIPSNRAPSDPNPSLHKSSSTRTNNNE